MVAGGGLVLIGGFVARVLENVCTCDVSWPL